MGGSLTVRTDGKVLRALRESAKLLQSEVQNKCGIKSNRMVAYEAGKPANIYDLRALAKFYRVKPVDITDHRDLERLAKVFNDLAAMFPEKIGSGNNKHKA